MTEAADVRKGPAKYDGSNIITGIIGGIQTINADATLNQFITTANPQLGIANDGVGGHDFIVIAGINGTNNTPQLPAPPGPPIPIPVAPGVRTFILSLSGIVDNAWWNLSAAMSSLPGGLPGTTVSKWFISVNGVDYESTNFLDSASLNITDYAHVATFKPILLHPGDFVELDLLYDAGGPLTIQDAFLQLARIGDQ